MPSRYHAALQNRKAVVSVPLGVTRNDCVDRIDTITQQLKGPMSSTERVLLAHDRADLRDILKLIDRAIAAEAPNA